MMSVESTYTSSRHIPKNTIIVSNFNSTFLGAKLNNLIFCYFKLWVAVASDG